MSTIKLVYFPDEALTTVCEPVTEFGPELHAQLDAMRPIMVENNGMGLAANQVGITKRFFIMKDKKGTIYEFINPEIIEKTGTTVLNEGCLSAPGGFVQMPRAQEVFVRAQDRNGEEFKVVAVDIEAVCVQHEIEHLDGKLFYAAANRQQRRAIEKLIEKL